MVSQRAVEQDAPATPAAPVHVFCFDRTLACRYAGPPGAEFLGLRPEELVGRHVDRFLPERWAVRPLLEEVLHTRRVQVIEHLEAPEVAESRPWALCAQPCALPTDVQTGRRRSRRRGKAGTKKARTAARPCW
jgi:hypothetical protein